MPPSPVRIAPAMVRVVRFRALDRAERIVHGHWDAWRQGRPTPCATAFERAQAGWRACPPGTDLTLSWDLVVSGAPKKRRRS